MQPVLSGRASPFNLSNQIATNPQPQDDIFAEFTSVNPTTSPPRTQSEATLFNKNGLQIIYKYRKTNTGLEGTVTYINTTPAVFTDVLIQYALPKSMTLNIGVCESSILQPLNVKPIVVDFNVFGGGVLKARVKVRYCVNGAWVEDAGEYSE